MTPHRLADGSAARPSAGAPGQSPRPGRWRIWAAGLNRRTWRAWRGSSAGLNRADRRAGQDRRALSAGLNRRDRRAWPAYLGLGLGLLALGPGIGRGYLLSYDMVFVPRPPVSAALIGMTGGPPRAVPSDAVVTFLSLAVPADLVQKMILILIFLLACSGAAALLTRGWVLARGTRPPALAALAAGVCYAWNPFVAERLLIGQWALLLGYAGLPWVVRSLCTGQQRISSVRLGAALLPAAVGGFAAMGISALAAVPAAWFGGQRGDRTRRLVMVLLALGLLSLPWLIPALAVPLHTDPRGVDAFAARADTPFGRVGSLLMLSGIWNAETVPRGYGGASSVVWLLVVLAAIGGYLLLARPRRICPGLGVAGLAGLAIAAVGVTSPGRAVLRDLVAAWPGFAVLRDGQQYLASLALAEAVGLGALVGWVIGDRAASAATAAPPGTGGGAPAASAGTGATAAGTGAVSAGSRAAAAGSRAAATAGSRAAAALGVMATLAPVLLLPGLAWGSAGRLEPARYPADWSRARQIIDGDPAAGSALLLPWDAYRRYRWNGSEAVYDPWLRLLRREVIGNDALQVGSMTVAAESTDSIRLNRIVISPGTLTQRLRAAGVRYVIVDAGPLLNRPDPDLAVRARLPGASVVLASRDLVVLRIPGQG